LLRCSSARDPLEVLLATLAGTLMLTPVSIAEGVRRRVDLKPRACERLLLSHVIRGQRGRKFGAVGGFEAAAEQAAGLIIGGLRGGDLAFAKSGFAGGLLGKCLQPSQRRQGVHFVQGRLLFLTGGK
jgi:hypothetical protein